MNNHQEEPFLLPTAEPSSLKRPLIAVILFFVMAFLIPLGAHPIHCWTESRYVEIPREMAADSNWVVPTLCGVPYFEKPALSFQTQLLAFRLLGVNRFAARLPNALAVLAIALFLLFFVDRVTGSRWTAYGTSIIFLTSGFVIAMGHCVTTDVLLSAALTWSIGSFFLACRAAGRREVLFWLVLCGAACGAGFLIKGFVALALPMMILTPYLVWSRDWRRLFLYPWIPLLVAFLVSLPWSLAIHRAEPGFWPYFFIEEHLHRFFSHTHDKDREPFYFYFPLFLLGMLPASGTVFASAVGWRAKDLWRRPSIRLALCWTVLPFVFFSVSSCKTVNYIFPIFPPMAFLLAAGITEGFLRDPDRVRRYLSRFFLIFGLLVVVVGAVTLVLFPLPWHRWFESITNIYPQGYALGFISVPLIILWGVVMVKERHRLRRAVNGYFLFLAPALMMTLFVLPIGLFDEDFIDYYLPRAMETVPIRDEDTIIAEGGYSAGYAWTLKRTDFIYLNPNKEISFWFSRYHDRAPGPIYGEFDPEKITAILAKGPQGKSIYITLRPPEEVRALLPRPAEAQCKAGGLTVVRY